MSEAKTFSKGLDSTRHSLLKKTQHSGSRLINDLKKTGPNSCCRLVKGDSACGQTGIQIKRAPLKHPRPIIVSRCNELDVYRIAIAKPRRSGPFKPDTMLRITHCLLLSHVKTFPLDPARADLRGEALV
jgi:hypothetical protein